MSVLVDTSAWLLALRRKRGDLNPTEQAIVAELAELVNEGRICLLGAIRQELLSGVKTPEQYERLRLELRQYPDEPVATSDYELAAKLANNCKSQGVTVSIVDALICSIALDRKFSIFTTDPDFLHFTKIIPIRLHLPRS